MFSSVELNQKRQTIFFFSGQEIKKYKDLNKHGKYWKDIQIKRKEKIIIFVFLICGKG